MERTDRNHKARFGDFEADLRSGELRKHGIRLKIQDQPFRVLALLLEHPGEMVTREELRQSLWPADTFVDFDIGLNSAIKKLRDVLGDSAEAPRYVETLPRRGYRFIAPVEMGREDAPIRGAEDRGSERALNERADPSGAPAPGVDEESRATKQPSAETPGRSGSRNAYRVALISVAATSLLAALVFWARHHAATPAKPSPGKIILAVLPFDNLSREPEQDFFSDGLTEEMTVQLGRLNPERLSVVARSSVARYKGSDRAAKEIGKELHADYLLEGSVRRVADRVRIAVQLIQVQDQTDLWAESYDRSAKDILEVQDSIARAVADQIHVTLVPKKQSRDAGPRPLDPAAHESYLKGRFYWNRRTAEGMQKASDYFQRATEEDPGYGAAYSGLADCKSGLAWHGFDSPAEALPGAHAAALRAIEIDPESPEGHASLGLVLHHRFEWSGAEREFKRALELDPQYANAHHWYGDYLSVRGRHEEALLEAKRALELDPLNLMIGAWLGLRYYLARKYDGAAERAREMVDLDPNFAPAHLVLGQSYVRMGEPMRGLTELQKAASLSGDSPLYVAQVGVAYAAAGRKTEALRIIGQLKEIGSRRYVSPYGVAQIYAALDEKEQSLRWLQAADENHAVWMSYVAVDPVFDRIRSDQRFREMLRRLDLTQ